MFARSAEGCTPFMQAVGGRAYPAALTLLNCALKLAARGESGEIDRAVLMAMLYPSGSSLDNSPLHVLCANDTCSFTWTGADHINQVSPLGFLEKTELGEGGGGGLRQSLVGSLA